MILKRLVSTSVAPHSQGALDLPCIVNRHDVTVKGGMYTPDKLMGVLLMGAAVVILLFLPWLDRSPVKSIRYKGWGYKIMLGIFAFAFVRLGMLGMAEGTPAETVEMRVWTFVYFGYFVLLFFLSPKMKTKPVPDRVTH